MVYFLSPTRERGAILLSLPKEFSFHNYYMQKPLKMSSNYKLFFNHPVFQSFKTIFFIFLHFDIILILTPTTKTKGIYRYISIIITSFTTINPVIIIDQSNSNKKIIFMMHSLYLKLIKMQKIPIITGEVVNGFK